MPPVILPREDWYGLPPRLDGLEDVAHPLQTCILTYSNTETCCGVVGCSDILKQVQRKHMVDQGMPDIAYNFMIDINGNIFEGRGWYYMAQDVEGYPQSWTPNMVVVAYLGSRPDGLLPLPRKSEAAKVELIRFGIEFGYLKKDYKFICK